MRAVAAWLALIALGAAAHASPDADADARRRAREYREACARAQVRHDLVGAKAACAQSVAAWDGDAGAWYVLGAVALDGDDRPGAADAFAHAVALRPDEPMYQMWLGIALADDAATRASAREHLARAVALEPRLWRAHYYLGRIARASDDPRTAAAELGRAIEAGPSHGVPYIALARLYLRWRYVDQAIQVASQGLTRATDPTNVAELYTLVGDAYVIEGKDDRAIDAYDHVLAAQPDATYARLERALAHARLGHADDARRDLEAVLAHPEHVSPLVRSAARQALTGLTAIKAPRRR